VRIMENERKISRLNGNHGDDESLINKKQVRKRHLINKLNYINFQDGTILINFRHVKYNQRISLQAKPMPCRGDELECIWLDTEKEKYHQLSAYEFQEIQIANGRNMLVITPDDIRINEQGVNLLLPETCYEVGSRKQRRYLCKGITAQLIQSSASFSGELVDFSTASFRVQVSVVPPQTFSWIDPESSVNLILSDDHEMLYAGDCKILQYTEGRKTRNYVVEPLNSEVRRFKPKDFRTVRQELVPSPHIFFLHPFTHKPSTLKIIDLSGSGFSVEEDKERAVLIPGMIIPKLELNFWNSFRVNCKVQVIHHNVQEAEKNCDSVKCGVAILEMDLEEHSRLLSLLHQATDGKSYLCNAVDLDDLWRFFFESGLIYPEKYEFIQANKDRIKATYSKIYNESPKIARHFIYQDKDEILGHLAMIRFYERSWMIQHHAANDSVSAQAAFGVLNQISRFINESHSLFSVQMDSVFCYFRPDNKFPNRVFGGVAANTDDPKRCSLDSFSYFHHQKSSQNETDLKKPWRLMTIQPEDLVELRNFYESVSGGLILKALELMPDCVELGDLPDEYRRLGFKREKHVFSLKKENSLKAVALLNISDIGLNLSDITSSIHVFVLDPEDLSPAVLNSMLSALSEKFDQDVIPVLLYPVSYSEKQRIPYEKLYNLWVLDAQHLDQYFKYLDRLFKRLNSLKARR